MKMYRVPSKSNKQKYFEKFFVGILSTTEKKDLFQIKFFSHLHPDQAIQISADPCVHESATRTLLLIIWVECSYSVSSLDFTV